MEGGDGSSLPSSLLLLEAMFPYTFPGKQMSSSSYQPIPLTLTFG